MQRRGALLPATLIAGAALAAACSSSSSNKASTGGSGTTATTTATTASTAGTGSSGGGGSLPTVSNATNLKVEPMPAAGTNPAPTTLETKDLVVGTGQTAVATNTVEIQYVGANYADGKVFDSSWS